MTPEDLKSMIQTVVQAEFKRYIPFLIKEIRKINTPPIKSVSPTPIPIKKENTLEWLNSIVDHDQLNKQQAAENELITINEDATPAEQKIVKSLNDAFTKDYSNLVKSMSKIPVK